MQQQEQVPLADRLKSGAGWIAFFSGALAVSVEVFSRRIGTFGERYIGLQAAAIVLLLPFYTLLWPGHGEVAEARKPDERDLNEEPRPEQPRSILNERLEEMEKAGDVREPEQEMERE